VVKKKGRRSDYLLVLGNLMMWGRGRKELRHIFEEGGNNRKRYICSRVIGGMGWVSDGMYL
jgi:hypothetical protein